MKLRSLSIAIAIAIAIAFLVIGTGGKFAYDAYREHELQKRLEALPAGTGCNFCPPDKAEHLARMREVQRDSASASGAEANNERRLVTKPWNSAGADPIQPGHRLSCLGRSVLTAPAPRKQPSPLCCSTRSIKRIEFNMARDPRYDDILFEAREDRAGHSQEQVLSGTTL